MSKSGYNIRNYRSSDFDSFVRLYRIIDKAESSGRFVSEEAISEVLSRPGTSPEQGIFIAETAGKMVGYADITPELAIGRVIFYCWIHPSHRRKGLATQLFEHAVQRARGLGAQVMHVEVPQYNQTARNILPGMGFKYVRRYIGLRLYTGRVSQQDMDEAASECRYLQPGEEEKLAVLQNRAFAEHWGYNPNTAETIIHDINMSHRSPEDVVLTYDGEKVTGYCWTEIIEDDEAPGGKRGLIYMIGTDPDYRGKGLGKKVLLAGIACLKNKGIELVELMVDSNNTVAYELYRSVGFELRSSNLWYEKPVD